MYKNYLFILSLFSVNVSLGTVQEKTIAEFNTELSLASTNKEKAVLCGELAKAYYEVNADSVCFYARQSMHYAQSVGDQKLYASSIHQLGVGEQKNGNVDEAIKLFYTALGIRERMKDYLNVASSNTSLGNIYLNKGVINEQEEEYDEADANYLKAKGFYEKSLQFAQLENDSNYISVAYRNIGVAEDRLFEYEKAIKNYENSYAWAPNGIRKLIWGEIELKILTSRYEMGEIDHFSDRYKELIAHFRKYDQIDQWINCNINQAAMLWTSNLSETVHLLEEADSLAQASGSLGFQIQIYSSFHEFYLERSDYEKALKYYKKYKAHKEKVVNKETEEKITELELKYNKEKVENQLANQRLVVKEERIKKGRLMNALIVVFILILVVIIFFVQRQRILLLKQKQIKENHYKEINSLLQQHELKSVEAMLEGQDAERKRIAEDLHDRLGSTLSAAKMYFESSLDAIDEKRKLKEEKTCDLLDRAIEDTRSIAHNLVSGTLSKFGLYAALRDLKNTIEGMNQIKVVLDFKALESPFNSDFEIQIYRIVQEVFSNALKHAKPTELNLKIMIKEEQETLLYITDNGKGFNQKKTSNGMGLKNIRARVAKLNGQLTIQSKINGGTSYRISFK